METRWLTDDEKATRLAALDERELDAEIVPLCRSLNAIAGVCTVSSCAGHFHDDERQRPYEGYISVLLSRPLSDNFDVEAGRLMHSPVLQVIKTYEPVDDEVHQPITIYFLGAAHGRLHDAAHAIVRFFSRLALK